MHEFLKILMKLFYIAFFRQVGWLLSRNEMQIYCGKISLPQTKGFPYLATIPVSGHGIPILCADGKSESRRSEVIRGVIEDPMPGHPLSRILPQTSEIAPLGNAVRSRDAVNLFFRELGFTWNQS